MSTPGSTYTARELGDGHLRINGRFDANGTNATSNQKGKGFYVARTAPGTYKVSLGPNANYRFPFRALITFLPGALVANGVYTNLKLLSEQVSNSADPSLVLVNTDNTGAPADVTATFFFELVVGTSELDS